jgi:hypothetical protein
MKKDEPLHTYDFDDEKKPQITRYALEKMLKDIRAALSKHQKIKVTIEKSP